MWTWNYKKKYEVIVEVGQDDMVAHTKQFSKEVQLLMEAYTALLSSRRIKEWGLGAHVVGKGFILVTCLHVSSCRKIGVS
jgi:hypothetical protein